MLSMSNATTYKHTNTSLWREFVDAKIPRRLRPCDASFLCKAYDVRPPAEWCYEMNGEVRWDDVIAYIVEEQN